MDAMSQSEREAIQAREDSLRVDRQMPRGAGSVNGRVSRLRVSSGALFALVIEGGNLVQAAFLRGSPGFEEARTLRAGDWIEALGERRSTQSGDTALFGESLRIVARCEESFPAWFDEPGEEAFRHRPDLALASSPMRQRAVRARFEGLGLIRDFMREEGFMEAPGMVLSSSASGASANPFRTRSEGLGQDLFLRVAQETQLVRLLASGFPRVFEMGPVFRNEGLSPRHNPEFWLLEAYEAEGSQERTRGLALECWARACASAGRGVPAALDLRVEEAIERFGGLSAAQIADAGFLARRLGRSGEEETRRLALWQWELFDQLEIPREAQFFIWGHPEEISPLAHADAACPGATERFEFHADGVELANGYRQVRSETEQRARFARQSGAAMGEDEAYCAALRMGLPEVWGFGAGLDRLIQRAHGFPSIRSMLPFAPVRGGAAQTQ